MFIFSVYANGCEQEGSPVTFCITAKLKKPLSEDTLLLEDGIVKRMVRVIDNVLDL